MSPRAYTTTADDADGRVIRGSVPSLLAFVADADGAGDVADRDQRPASAHLPVEVLGIDLADDGHVRHVDVDVPADVADVDVGVRARGHRQLDPTRDVVDA